MDYDGRRPLNERRMSVWLQAKVRDGELGLQPRQYAGSVRDALCRCIGSLRLEALFFNKCYTFAF